MELILEVNKNDSFFYSKTWRTFKCVCGCQDIRVTDCSEIVICPDCKRGMNPQMFVNVWTDSIVLSFRPITGSRYNNHH